MIVPLGAATVSFELPDCDVTVCEPPGARPVGPRRATEEAMADPHGPTLGERVGADDDVAVVVTDLTRDTPDEIFLDSVFADLADAGVDRDQVTVVVGLGLHRPMTDDELDEALGEYADLAVNHDPEATVEVGTVDGCSVGINERVAAADAVVSTGMVEPHQYAGFSGGSKTVVIGAGSESQIEYSHGPAMLGRDGVRLGRVDGNPFRSFVDRAGDVAGVDFCCNVTKGPEGFIDVAAGDPRAVVRDLAGTAREALSVSVEGEYDAVVAAPGAYKDSNLYQATRAATYVALGDRNPLASDGRIVVPATLPEGAGDGTGERRFYDRLSNATDAEALYREMAEGYEAGAQRAFVVARVLRDHDVWVTNSENPSVVEECLMQSAPTIPEAIEPGSEVLVVPDALNTLLV